MADCMIFPETVEEFMEQYKLVDTEQVYSNGTEFVPIFRMEQWFEHQTDRIKFVQEAVNTLMNTSKTNGIKDKCFRNAARFVQNAIDGEPQDFERIPDEPQRNKGHWIRHPEQRNIFNGKTIECSECHEKYTVQYVEDELFCRHCGADMREPEDIPMEYFENGGR